MKPKRNTKSFKSLRKRKVKGALFNFSDVAEEESDSEMWSPTEVNRSKEWSIFANIKQVSMTWSYAVA